MHKGGEQRLYDFVVPVKPNEAKEGDANVHVHVEHNRRVPAHKQVQLRGCNFGVSQDFERKRQAHEEISHSDVLEIDNETLGAGDMEEDPGCQGVEREPSEEDEAVEQRDEGRGYHRAVCAVVPRGVAAGVEHPVVSSFLEAESRGAQQGGWCWALCSLLSFLPSLPNKLGDGRVPAPQHSHRERRGFSEWGHLPFW